MHPIAYTTNIALKIMEQIINNPAYKHITEKILLNLSFQDLLSCQLLNKNCNQIMEKPLFWLKKWISRGLLSTTSQKDWSKAMQLTKNNTDLKENIVSYLKRILKKPFFMKRTSGLHFSCCTLKSPLTGPNSFMKNLRVRNNL